LPTFLPEPEHTHGKAAKTAVLLVNLGTPQAPTKEAVRPYLKEFLSDPRVVEIPRPVWWLILNGIILNTRPAKSAEKYAKIWTPEGSPLKVHTERQTKLLRGYLGHGGNQDITVVYAMRYGQPAIAATLEQLRRDNHQRILVLPLYPQYAASSTASVFDAVTQCMQCWRNVPEIRFVRGFHDHPGYIAALAQSVRDYWMKQGQADKLVLSFHGVPRRSLTMGDPYHCECHKTARLLAEALKLPAERYAISFQSRFGSAEWLKPYTQPMLEDLGRGGEKRVDVICPGFVADCLETLEEIALECKTAFLGAGGKEFHYIPCLNERDDWIQALTGIARSHLGGWLDSPQPPASSLAMSALRAKALGATA